jgi:hypothetical protein
MGEGAIVLFGGADGDAEPAAGVAYMGAELVQTLKEGCRIRLGGANVKEVGGAGPDGEGRVPGQGIVQTLTLGCRISELPSSCDRCCKANRAAAWEKLGRL